MTDQEKMDQAVRMANSWKENRPISTNEKVYTMSEQIRYNKDVVNRKVSQKKEGNRRNKVIVALSLITAISTFTLLAYEQTKSNLKETQIDPRTGYVLSQSDYNPTSSEVFEEMYKEIFGKGR